jgi:CO/xanthine dehydrogenase FAD-binding subunit
MRPFGYLRPTTIDQAIAALADPAASALAGGTDLIVRLRRGHIRPSVVVDMKGVRALSSEIVLVDDCLRFGARVTMTSIIKNSDAWRYFPALIEAASVVGSVQIRNRATLAGNICNASPAADTVPALLVYSAVVNAIGPAGSRRVRLEDFFTGPGRTVLGRGEIVESIDLPIPTVLTGAAFGRITRRRGVDLATINLCGLVTATGHVRFAFGAVAPTPFVASDDSGALAQDAADEPARAAALKAIFSAARPITDVRGSREYRMAMLDVMTRRTWTTAVGRLRKRTGSGSAFTAPDPK